MGVDVRVVDWLLERGDDARHLREEGLQRLPDEEVFAKAIRESRILLTFDLDFGEIAAFSGESRVGVILFRLNNTRTVNIIHRLTSVLDDVKILGQSSFATLPRPSSTPIAR